MQKACAGVCGGTGDGCGGKYDCPCDAGAPPPPSDAGAGPTCFVEQSQVGTCANHPQPLCSTYPGTSVSGCQNLQPSGYAAKCCTP